MKQVRVEFPGYFDFMELANLLSGTLALNN